MPFPVRFLDSELDEEKGEKCENRRLQESDEYFEKHERNGQEVRREEYGDGDDYFACEDVAEEPKRKRDNAHQFADELNEADGEADGIFEGILNEFAAVLPETDGEDARHFDDEERNDGEHQRHSEVGIRRAQKRVVVVHNRANTRYEVQHVAHENKEEYRHEEREEFARHIAALECFGDVVVHKSDHRFHERLELSGYHLELAAYQKRDGDEYRDNEPARNQRIGDRDSEKIAQLFRRYRNVNALIHWRQFSIFPNHCAIR